MTKKFQIFQVTFDKIVPWAPSTIPLYDSKEDAEERINKIPKDYPRINLVIMEVYVVD